MDYGQKIELPYYAYDQPGCIYYYSSLEVYNFGIVDHAYDYGKEVFVVHLHAHVYHAGIQKKFYT